MTQALISLHDVTPAHEERVFAAIDHLRSRGAEALGLLVVPDFHHRAHLDLHPGFCERLRAVLRPRDEVLLHGFWHLADTKATGVGGQLAAAALTAGEGEFHGLTYAQARERMESGLDVLQRTLGLRPKGFVAPAWLDNPQVRQAAKDLGLHHGEDHLRVFDLATRRSQLAPAMSLASRDPVRRVGSRWTAILGAPLLAPMPLVRLAVHPNDYRHVELVDALDRVLGRWLPAHRPTTHLELWSN